MPLDLITIEPKTTPAKASVILMHGLGADGYDFVDTIPAMNLAETAGIRFIFPHAPIRKITFANHTPMRAWFDIADINELAIEDEAGIKLSQKQVEEIINQEIEKGIACDKIILAGFSQGGAIALHCGLRFPQQLGGILVLSSWLPLSKSMSTESNHNNIKTPIMFCHGNSDNIVKLSWAEKSHAQLKNMGYSTEIHTFPMEHNVCNEELILIGKWLTSIVD